MTDEVHSMTNSRTVSKNTFVLLAGSVISNALRIVYIGVLARYVGAEGIGQISTATALVSLAILLVNFGLDRLVIRDIAGDETRAAKYVANVAFIRLLLTLVMAIALAAVVSQSDYSDQTEACIAIYALVYVFDAFSDVGLSVFHAFQKMEYVAIIQFARDLLNVAISLLCISLGWSLVAIVSISAFASLFKLIISVTIMQWRFVRLVIHVDLAFCRHLLLTAIPFAILLSINVAHSQLSTIILSRIDTSEAVGIYSAATFPVVTLLILPTVFAQSIFPAFSHYYRSSPTALARSYRISYKAMLVVGLPMGAGAVLASKYMMALVYGPGFEDAVSVMNILAVQLLTMVGYVNGAFLHATNRQTLFATLQAVMLTLNAILSFILIPTYSYQGAALAVVAPTILSFGLYSALCHRCTGSPLPWGTAFKTGSGALVMSGASYLALNHGVSVLVVLVLLAPAMYLISLVALKVISAEEWRLIKEIIRSTRLRPALLSQAGD